VITRDGGVVLKRWRHGVVVVGVLVTVFFLGHGIEAHWGAGSVGTVFRALRRARL
jgi:hypothetical protein